MDDYPNATENLQRIATEIDNSKHIRVDLIPKNVRSEITSTNEEIKQMVKENDKTQAEILKILITKITKLEDILK